MKKFIVGLMLVAGSVCAKESESDIANRLFPDDTAQGVYTCKAHKQDYRDDYIVKKSSVTVTITERGDSYQMTNGNKKGITWNSGNLRSVFYIPDIDEWMVYSVNVSNRSKVEMRRGKSETFGWVWVVHDQFEDGFKETWTVFQDQCKLISK